jgi:aryl-alcohol dehydrogenase (NADP+)
MRGQLTERSRTDEYAGRLYGRPEDQRVAEIVEAIAATRGVQPAQVALAWVLNRLPGAAPIVGATRAEHLDAAVATLTLKLEAAEVLSLDAAYAPRPKAGHS